MIIVPPRHYVVIDNPVTRGNDGKEEYDAHGQVKLRHGDSEVRLPSEPFALFPGEKIAGGIQPLQIVAENAALRLRAKRDFVDRYAKDGQGRAVKRRAGEEWLFGGLATYVPQSEEEIVQTNKAFIIKPNQALKLRAKDDCVDYLGKTRKAGEMWLVRKEGAYLPAVNEIEMGLVDAIVLTPKIALHIRAAISFTDSDGIERKSGEEWLVTREQFETYIPECHEVVTSVVQLTVLTHRQWCVIADPIGENGKAQLGELKYVRGPATFFLQPGESLNIAITSVHVLSPNQALWVRAKEAFVDHTNKKRSAGDKWLVYGPGEYWPPVQAEAVQSIRSFLAIEPLGLYFFQPIPFVVTIFLVMLALFILSKFIPGAKLPVKVAAAATKGKDEL
jgi:major vault protein